MSSNPIYFAPYQVALVEPSTGLMSRPWYLFFQALFNRVGGSIGPSNDDLEQLALENLDTSIADAAGAAAQTQSAQVIALDADLNEAPSRQDVADALTLGMAALDQADAAQSGFANPTAKVGLLAVNGSAQTAMRSDASPPIDVAIAPTWTAAHIWTAAMLANQIAGLFSINSTVAANAALLFCNLGGVNKTRIGVEGTAGAVVAGSAVGDTVYFATGNHLFSIGGAAAAAKVTNVGVTALSATLTAAAPAVAAAQVGYGSTTSLTANTTPGGPALPALAAGYTIINVAGTNFKQPYFAV